MRASSWLPLVFIPALLAGIAPTASAQDKLPAAMAGTWNGTSPGKGTPFGGAWSVAIEKQAPDGAVEGKMTWDGRVCGMDAEPFTGRFDGTELTLVAQFRDKFPNANCPKSRMVLKRRGGGNDFEGTIPGSQFNYRLTLVPK